MKECNCIVIDDNRSFTTSATITNFLKRASDNNQLQINLIHLNPKQEKFVDDKGVIVPDRIVSELDTTRYLKQSIQLIICDYNLGEDITNGFEIVRLLRNRLECKKKILLYSSNIDDVIDNIIKGPNPETVRRVIKDLVSSKISAFCQRDDHLTDEMIKHLLQELEFSSDSFFENLLFRYKDYRFKAPYDKFDGWTLGQVAETISKERPEGERLKKEMIQQVIAYMIDLKDE